MATYTFDIPLEIRPIREEGYHVFVEILVNGNPARMLLDTGASRTVFDTESLKELHQDLLLEENEDKATGLGSNAVDNFIAILDELSIAGCSLKEYQVGALDLQHVNMSYESMDMPPIAGVLGSDVLFAFKAVIDFGNGKLTLSRGTAE